MKRKYYIYIYTENGLPFYVGKGFGNRDTSHTRYKKVLNKCDIFHCKLRGMIASGREWQIVRLFEPLNESEAFAWEIGLIAYWGRRDLGTGTLCNMTSGGEGCSGLIHSDETREIISQRNIERFSDPTQREAQSKRVAEYNSDPAVRKAFSQRMIEYYSDPAVREANSQRMIEYTSDPAVRERLSQCAIKYNSDPAVREAQSQRMIEYNSDPAVREAQSQRVIERFSDPAQREAQSQVARKQHADKRVAAFGEWCYQVDLAKKFGIKKQTFYTRIKKGILPFWACMYSPGQGHTYPGYCKPAEIPRIFGSRPSGEAFDYMYANWKENTNA